MEIGEPLYVFHRKPWREWLEANFEAATEIWLIYPNKASSEPRILYNDAVEEALCFGWIDSIIKKLDSMHAVQRFTPRNPKSGYSQQNKERLRWLAGKGLLHPPVRESVSDILDAEELLEGHRERQADRLRRHRQVLLENVYLSPLASFTAYRSLRIPS